MGRDIRKYEVFKQAHRLVLRVYSVTRNFPSEEKFGLVNQMRRSAYSIPMNLIEGAARDSEAEFRHFVNIARGSCAEIQYQLQLCCELKYIIEKEFEELDEGYSDIGKMLTGLMKKLKATG